MTHSVQFSNINVPALGDGEFLHVMKAPSDKGGVTIVDAKIVNNGTASYDAHFALENWGTAGTAIKSTSAGTVATQGTAGTAGTVSHAGTAPGAAFNVQSANQFLDQGEWLVLRRTGSDAMDTNSLHVEWIQGRVGVAS